MTGETVSYTEGERWLQGLACELAKFTPAHRADLQSAVKAVLGIVPVAPPAPTPPSYTPLQNPAALPEGVPPVFGLCGRPRSGKDVVADYLSAHYRGVARLAFSDAIREEVNNYLSCFPYLTAGGERVHLITEENKSEPRYRHLLQAWALGRRDENPYHWADEVKLRIAARLADGARLVIATGVRMPTDVELIESLAGETLRVVRPGNTYRAEHDVEKGLDDVPEDHFVTVYNPVEGDLGPYERNIEAMLRGEPQFCPPSEAETPATPEVQNADQGQLLLTLLSGKCPTGVTLAELKAGVFARYGLIALDAERNVEALVELGLAVRSADGAYLATAAGERRGGLGVLANL